MVPPGSGVDRAVGLCRGPGLVRLASHAPCQWPAGTFLEIRDPSRCHSRAEGPLERVAGIGCPMMPGEQLRRSTFGMCGLGPKILTHLHGRAKIQRRSPGLLSRYSESCENCVSAYHDSTSGERSHPTPRGLRAKIPIFTRSRVWPSRDPPCAPFAHSLSGRRSD